MAISLENVVLVAAGLLTGLHAGLLFDFSVDIVPSLRKLKAKAHIEMFQSIDSTIENPVFFLSFLGPIVLLPLATFLFRGEPQFSWLLAVSLIQIIACNVVTLAIHLPLNAKLAKVDTSKISDQEAEKIRRDFQGLGSRWTRFHAIRTLAGITATGLMFIAAIAG